jgi:hypothetical protein
VINSLIHPALPPYFSRSEPTRNRRHDLQTQAKEQEVMRVYARHTKGKTMLETESYEVQWCDEQGMWRSIKNGLTMPEACALVAEYKNWNLRVLKAVRTEIRLTGIENHSESVPRQELG